MCRGMLQDARDGAETMRRAWGDAIEGVEMNRVSEFKRAGVREQRGRF